MIRIGSLIYIDRIGGVMISVLVSSAILPPLSKLTFDTVLWDWGVYPNPGNLVS
jgi:hypothetical protein